MSHPNWFMNHNTVHLASLEAACLMLQGAVLAKLIVQCTGK